MNITKLIPIMVLFLVLAVASVSALPITIEKVKIDDTILEPNESNKLSIERGDELPVDVYFTVSEDVENLEVLAFISGYEYNYLDPVSDSIGPFDAEADVKYHKKLKLNLNDDFDEDSYKLRIVVSDRYGEEVIQSFNLKVDVPRHELKIQDVIFNPELNIKAGSALLAQVRLENKGEKQEDDIKVKVSIPELGVSGADYVDEIEDTDDSEESEEIYLRIPMCAKPGIYEVKVSAEYANGRRQISTIKSINIEANDMCEETPKVKTTITLGKQLENVLAGETATYPITITNNLKQSKSYTVSLDAGDWAESVKLTPASTILVDGESSETIYVHATTDSKTTGAKVLTATISSAGNTLKQLILTTNITAKPSNWLKLAFEAIVIILAILVILVAIIVGYLKLKEDNDDTQSETYY
ncbi:hypothetical protein JW851_04610 [Candidatus Woesearchaeota archaeon]|nr:hypothetical protein [Candidatus Woesearchaeota archaeon]